FVDDVLGQRVDLPPQGAGGVVEGTAEHAEFVGACPGDARGGVALLHFARHGQQCSERFEYSAADLPGGDGEQAQGGGEQGGLGPPQLGDAGFAGGFQGADEVVEPVLEGGEHGQAAGGVGTCEGAAHAA